MHSFFSLVSSKLRLRAESLLLLISFGLGFAFQGGMFVLISRILGPTEFGIFAGAFALATGFSSLSGIGGGNVLLLAVSQNRHTFAVGFGTALAFVGATFFPLLSLAIPLSLAVSSAFALCAAPLLVSELIGSKLIEVCQLSFQAVDRLKLTALLNGLTGPVRFLAGIVFWLCGWRSAGSWALTYTIANLALSILAVTWVVLGVSRPLFSLADLKSRWRLGTSFAIAGLSRIVYVDADKYLLNWLGFPSAAGIYSAATRVVNFAFLPVFSTLYAEATALFRAGSEGYVQSWRVMRKLLVFIAVYSLITGGIIVLASPLVVLLLGPEYIATAGALKVVAPLILFQGVGILFGNALMGVGRQGVRTAFQFGVAVISVSANLFLIPEFGWRGAAYTSIATAAILSVGLMFAFALGLRREKANAGK